MNRAIQIQQHIPSDNKVTILHPVTLEEEEEGYVTGTWSENRVNEDPDQGFFVKCANGEIYPISHKFITL